MRTLPLLLLLAACAVSSSPPAVGGPENASVEMDSAWSDAAAARIAVADASIDASGARPSANLPALGARVAFDELGATVSGRDGSLTLGLASFGRASQRAVDPTAPVVGAVVAGLLGPDGIAARRLEYGHEGITEWFVGTPGGLEHGWTVDERPAGEGTLRFTLATDAEVLAVDDESVELLDDGGQDWRYADLAAYDATGRPLDARFALDDSLVVEVDDAEAVYPIEIDPLLITADTTLTGPSANSYFGIAVANAGDVNGDGYDDVIVGASQASTLTGRAYVYHGSASGLSSTAASTLSGGNRTGSTPYYGCGGRVTGGADLNHDGYDDVAMACVASQACVRVYLGSASGVSTTATATLTGVAGTDYGSALAMMPSVDSDDYADLLVGAPSASSSRGKAYLYAGKSSGISTTVSVTIDGGVDYHLGFAVGDAGDVNADGYEDAVVTAPGYLLGAGRASVYYGSSTGLSTTSVTHLYGSALSVLGVSAAGGGDVNGDGYDDLAVGNYAVSSSTTTYAYVFHGTAAGIDSTATTTLSGTGSFGGVLAVLPDTDRDGYSDLAVGAPSNISVSVYPGSASGVSTTAGTTLSESGSHFGFAIAGADVNGDGYTDVAVGDYLDSSTYGKAYVYLGYADADHDGYGGGGGDTADCDDTDATVNPDAVEIAGDAVDQDCDGIELCLLDADADGWLDGGGATVVSADMDCSDATEALAIAPTTDCDDGDAAVNPGATEGVADGVDQDCDAEELCYDDDDGDGALDSTADTRVSPDLDCLDSGEGGLTTRTDDCDDTNGTIYVGATEIAGDGVDQDCDGAELCYADVDGDGYTDGSTVVSANLSCADAGELPLGGATGDCDDHDAAVSPAGVELCSTVGVDDDCDGLADESDAADTDIWFVDTDVDGYGDARSSVSACDQPSGYVADATDCDDGAAAVHPDAAEVCGGGDANCNGRVDDADAAVTGQTPWYADADSDGYGDASAMTVACVVPAGSVANASDCDDTSASAHPGATEITADGVDEDCDGGETCYLDGDVDGYRGTALVGSTDLDCSDPGEADATTGSDCDDADASVSPGATEVVGDGVDQDCDTLECCFADIDGDGYHDENLFLSANLGCDGAGEASAAVPDGDCEDLDATVNPGAIEVAGDAVDQNCDGAEQCFVDADDDGYRPDAVSEVASSDTDCDDAGEALAGEPEGDCDDIDSMYHPGAAEPDCADPNDYNCDGSAGVGDQDGDGYGACEECDDANAAVNPSAVELPGDDVDQDCDGTELCYVDADTDGHRPDATSTVASADIACVDAGEADASAPADDCDDADASIFPGAIEVIGDGIDEDCDGGERCYADGDNDGYRGGDAEVVSSDADCTNSGEAGATDPTGDCDDSSAAFHPGASESDCADPNDYNCDGATGLDDHDGDGYGACEECDDGHSAINPGAVELCNGVDDDCSGSIDDGASDAGTLYADADGDGFGDPAVAITVCGEQSGYVSDGTDCDDADPTAFPGATEVVGDGVDQDCDGSDTPAGGGDTGAGDGGDSGLVGVERVGGLYGGCDTSGGAGLAGLGVLIAGLAGGRRRR